MEYVVMLVLKDFITVITHVNNVIQLVWLVMIQYLAQVVVLNYFYLILNVYKIV